MSTQWRRERGSEAQKEECKSPAKSREEHFNKRAIVILMCRETLGFIW